MRRILFLSLSGIVFIFVVPTFAQQARHKPAVRAVPVTDIRRVDFKNFTYQVYDEVVHLINGKRPARSIGEFSVYGLDVTYGDLTGNGKDEAAVVLHFGGGGSGQFTTGYIYTLRNGQAELLTTIKGGDRAFAGIKSVTIQNNLLIVEREQGEAACCPDYFETTRYRWNGVSLVQVGDAQRRSAR